MNDARYVFYIFPSVYRFCLCFLYLRQLKTMWRVGRVFCGLQWNAECSEACENSTACASDHLLFPNARACSTVQRSVFQGYRTRVFAAL